MTFNDFGLLGTLIKTLKAEKLSKPTEIQNQIIPLMMSMQSVVGVSETGSGKTLAYALPMMNLVKALEQDGNPVVDENSPRAVVMAPTRELGEQIAKVFKTFTHDTRLRVRPALGGMTLEQARRNTSGPFEILLATPGRLVQMLEKDLISLKDVRMLVFDEADQMMDQGFISDTNFVLSACPKDVHLSLFSATVSNTVQLLMNNLFSSAEVIRSKNSGKVVQSLVTKNLTVEDGKRWPLFEKVLNQKVEGGTIIFNNTREQCDKVAKEMTEKGYACVVYRGEMDKNERRQNLKKFRNGEIEFLVATDLAGRGLDVEHVGRVINFHLPQEMENYLHRVGRTARAGRKGLVVNLVTERDSRLIGKLESNKAPSLERKVNHELKASSQTRFNERLRGPASVARQAKKDSELIKRRETEERKPKREYDAPAKPEARSKSKPEFEAKTAKKFDSRSKSKFAARSSGAAKPTSSAGKSKLASKPKPRSESRSR